MQTQLIDISFAIVNVADIVSSIGTTAYPGGTTCTSLDADPNSNVWLEQNSDGVMRLCTTKAFGKLIQGNFVNSGSGAYSVNGTTFETLYPAGVSGFVLQTHPIHAPK